METMKTDAVRRKLMRGAILKLLSQGQPMLIQMLEVMLKSIGEDVEHDMLPCVNFLLDRGYVRVWNGDTEDMPPAPGVLLCITANGQDVVDGTTKDPSVILPAEGRR